jgi:hypothetical protein
VKLKTVLLSVAFCAANFCVQYGSAVGKDFRSDPAPPAANACPGDQVVWVNTRSHIYHFAGQTWFGHTKDGKYLCRHAADDEGDRPTHNGQ